MCHAVCVALQVNQDDAEGYPRMIELWFQFCMIWSICASVDESGRRKMDTFIREMEAQFPPKVSPVANPSLCLLSLMVQLHCLVPSVCWQDTIYEYCVDVKNRGWLHWEEKLKSNWRYLPK